MSVMTVYHNTIEDVRKEMNRDQYSQVASFYDEFIGSVDQRTDEYKHFFGDILRKYGCVDVLDVACGTGVDSILLLEQGFNVVSTDGSDHMLDFARTAKLRKISDPKYRHWKIEKANWKTLSTDVQAILPGTLFDAVICLANSFSHLLDQRDHKTCLTNFVKCLKPGGVLLIDHRNFDATIEAQPPPKKNAYYNYKHKIDAKTSVHLVRGKAEFVTFSVQIDKSYCNEELGDIGEFQLCYYPLRISAFTQLLDEAFSQGANHIIYGDFQPMGQVPVPGYYLHVIRKPEY